MGLPLDYPITVLYTRDLERTAHFYERVPDLLPVLRDRHATGSGALYLGEADVHWTVEGHAVVAEALAQWLDLD